MSDQNSFYELVILLTTEANYAFADDLAKELLRRRLVACVSLREVKSRFYWQGELEQINEVQLLIKTTRNKLNNLLEVINQLHSYQNPELLYWNVSSEGPYAEWIEGFVNSTDPLHS